MAEDSSGQNHTPLIQIPATVFCILTPLVVATRFWSRRKMKSVLGYDDWTILGSMIFSLADCAVLLAACSFGFGKRSRTLTFFNKIMALKLFYCSQILYKISLNLTKASILLLYLRAFPTRPFNITCWILIVIVVAYGIGSAVATIIQCSPLPRAWDKTIPGKCFNLTAFWYTNASYAIATDLVLLALPVRVVWSLRLRLLQKIALVIGFSFGAVVTGCSIVRMTTLMTSSTSTDSTYDISSTSWANIESNIAILCACLPVFRRPLSLLFPRLLSSLGHSSLQASQREHRRASHAGMDNGQWADDDPLKNRAARELSMTTVVGGYAGRDCGSEEFILEYVGDVDVGSTDSRSRAETIQDTQHHLFVIKYKVPGEDLQSS